MAIEPPIRGNVLNQCQYVYNDFGQLVTEYQVHDGTVNTSTTPRVGYSFADGSSNTIRPTGLVYPNGLELTDSYKRAGSVSDGFASRIASIIDDDATHLADDSNLGRQTIVVQDETEPQPNWPLVNQAGTNDPDSGDIDIGLLWLRHPGRMSTFNLGHPAISFASSSQTSL